ncbi:aldehyde dehydrogenase [Nocardia sp. NPDC057272]|uniref:aldehyde dehydrogenase n=1 Tax=unclassified Nocardia TaxID=2637762 RepID=UPI0036260227
MSGAHDHNHHFIGGRLQRANSCERLDVINPATEEVFGSIVDGDAADVDAAVRAARDAGSGWAQTDPTERGRLLRALADAFEARGEEISALVTKENGTPISVSRAMQSQVPLNYRYFATLAEQLEPEEVRATMTGDAVITREPLGVVGAITPWNGPQPLTAWKLGPALAAGCTAVVKPAPDTSLDAFLFAEVVQQAGLPPGTVNIVTGARETGALLVSHPDVRKVAFTGSVRAGRAIGASCGRDLKHVTLELGGKAAGILLDDVDLAAFAPFVRTALTPNTGQTCRALSRILAPRARYDEIVAMLADTMTKTPLGDPENPQTFYGPLANAAQLERVLSYLEIGKQEGAEVIVGGGRPAGFERGYYVEPTLFGNVTNDMRIAREEIFGPVVVVMPYDSIDEAVDIANDTEYGLGGGVFSADKDKATDVARRIVSGTVGVNNASFPMDAPFGGMKNSGLGRELGPRALDAYLEYKTVFRAG